ncbi:MAG: flagellar export chaperone FliS [Candidimonas sp.]|nr:MAG: flagellar export chaperone FliS [Candidimonas sp.]
MYGSRQGGVHAYANVGIETGAATASPHKLIIMLFDGAMLAIATGLQHMNAGNIAAKGKSISHAITIIDGGLRACLDKDAGGGIAENLDALYEYMSRRLLVANLNNQPEILEEVHHLLHDLKQAWGEMDTATAAAESLA